MNIDSMISSAIIGGIVGSVAVFAIGILARKKKMKIGEGRKIGLNLSTDQKCPACHESLPTFRRPKNFRQMMWGGWTCGKCGAQFDKWLKPVGSKK